MKHRCYIFDLDGTIYFGDTLADNANAVILRARQNSDAIFFVTNNSAKSRTEIYEKLLKMGIDVNLEEVITSGYAIAKYLATNNLRNVYCIGTHSLKGELKTNGIEFSSDNIENIVVGYNKDFKLDDLTELLNLKVSKEVKLIVANKERKYPSKNKQILAGAGPIVSAVEYALNKATDVIIGKPNRIMLEIILKGFNFEPKEVCVIGDSLDSDVKMAQLYGADSILITDQCYDNIRTIKKLEELLEII